MSPFGSANKSTSTYIPTSNISAYSNDEYVGFSRMVARNATNVAACTMSVGTTYSAVSGKSNTNPKKGHIKKHLRDNNEKIPELSKKTHMQDTLHYLCVLEQERKCKQTRREIAIPKEGEKI